MNDLFPAAFEQRMRRLLSDEWDAFSQAFSRPLATRGLRCNTLKITASQLQNALPFSLSSCAFSPLGFVTDTPFKAGKDPLHHAGAYYMQEPSAMSAVTVLAPKKGERILDLCAAPGGKSTQIAALLDGTGLLWCNEYVPARARILTQNLERCGVRNGVVTVGDTAALPPALGGFFDAVLADVPCSGEGMFRKEPEALTEWSEDNVHLCAKRGQEILHNAAQCVRKGGRLVLSTCTFAPEENEWAVVRFLQTHPDFTLVDCGVDFGRAGFDADRIAPFGTPDEMAAARNTPLHYCRRILPTDGGEGHFIALFIRDGEEQASLKPFASKPTDAIRAAQDLYADCFTDTPDGLWVTVGDTVRLLPVGIPKTDLRLLYAGVAVAAIHTGRTLRAEPEHAVFQSAKAEHCRRLLSLSADDPRIVSFLQGNELTADTQSGYTAVAVEEVVCGFGKASNGKLKNHYPKGLRIVT